MTWYKPRQRELSSARYFFFFSWDKIWWSGWTLTSQSSSSPRSSGTPCWGWSCSSCTSTSPAWASLMSSILSFCQYPVEVCQRWWCSGWTFTYHHHQHHQCQQHHHLDHLVDKHAGEDGDKDADNGETEHCAKTRVDRPVDHLTVRCGCEHKPIGGRC